RRAARHRLDDIDAGVQTIALETAEEEDAILGDRSAERAAELILLERRFGQSGGGVEVVRRVELVAAQVLEGSAVEEIAARLGDDADLAAAAGAEFRGIGARLDAELLDVLEARLQLEGRHDLAVQVARRGVDDRRPVDAVVPDGVLLDRASAEPDVL